MATTDKPIAWFKGRYRFLSNFWHVDVEFEGVTYPSTEHAYQAAKTIDVEERKPILSMTVSQAKQYGRTVTMRADWDEVKLGVMRGLLAQKFNPEKYPSLAAELVATHPHELIEGNTWNDTFWGVCRGEGENWLGKSLMELRDKLVAQIAIPAPPPAVPVPVT